MAVATDPAILARLPREDRELICNEHGVLWRDLYDQARANGARCLAAHRAALEAWMRFEDAVRENKKPNRKLKRLAVELTETALG